MSKPNTGKAKQIWLSALILFVCVAATAIAIASRLNAFLSDDSGAISLTGEEAPATESGSAAEEEQTETGSAATQEPATEPVPTTEPTPAGTDSTSATQSSEPAASATAPQVTQPPKNPGFEASDAQTVWSTDTQVEIFRVSYENGEQVITVNSGNGDKVIAPGTENSYTFKLKNTGDVALDYLVEVDAYFTPSDISIPITGRLSRYDGTWVAGSKEEFAAVSVLNTAEDAATLGAGKYTYYTLDWRWPFESGNDALDTMLGNLAAQEELVFTIVIKTTATESTNPDDGSGITPPPTGDDANLTVWTVLAVTSFVMMLLLIFGQGNDRRRYGAEAEKD